MQTQWVAGKGRRFEPRVNPTNIRYSGPAMDCRQQCKADVTPPSYARHDPEPRAGSVPALQACLPPAHGITARVKQMYTG
jgi:hypothetical protein